MAFRVYKYPEEETTDKDFIFMINDEVAPLHQARVSKMPFNRRWPGYQRSIDQTEINTFASFEIDEAVSIRIKPADEFKEVKVRPSSKNIIPKIENGTIDFILPEAGAYTVEIDGYHKAVHIFADSPKDYKDVIGSSEIIYFGKGFHDAGMIELKSNQTLFIDEGAVVFSCIYAKDAENIKIIGRGILDNSRNKEEILYDVEPGDGTFAITNSIRKHTIQLEYCTNIIIDGITIRDSLVYNIRPICCENLSINNVKIIGCWRYNSDGIDMHNCVHTTIRNCFIRTFDDSICVKGFDFAQDESDMYHNGRHYDMFDDVLVEKCVIWNDWGRALEIGAETRAKEIKNIIFSDCDIIHGTGCMMDVQNVDYADIHDITFENIRVEYDHVIQTPAIQNSENQTYSDDENSTYKPMLLCSMVYYHPEYSAGGSLRGKNSDITFKKIFVSSETMPPSEFAGFSDEFGVDGIKIIDLFLNGKKIASLDDANIKVGEFVTDISIS
ncbi:MAG: glycosyl hydrolase family 28 protein [Saccharofermentanales bacterium]